MTFRRFFPLVPKRRFFIGLIAGIVCLALPALSGCSSSRPAGGETTIRVMTWNIHHGEGLDHKVDVDRIGDFIKESKADIVALQEVDRGVERTKKIDIITLLADKTGMTYAFGKTIDFQGGDYGNGFLTRYPIVEEHDLLFSPSPGGEQRGLHWLVLDVRGEEIIFAGTHLDSRRSDTARVETVEELKKALEQFSTHPIIVCGDFNDTPGSRTVEGMKQMFADSWELIGRNNGLSFPSDEPKKRIDFVFVLQKPKPDSVAASTHLVPVSASVLQSSASDHLPVVVDFKLTTER